MRSFRVSSSLWYAFSPIMRSVWRAWRGGWQLCAFLNARTCRYRRTRANNSTSAIPRKRTEVCMVKMIHPDQAMLAIPNSLLASLADTKIISNVIIRESWVWCWCECGCEVEVENVFVSCWIFGRSDHTQSPGHWEGQRIRCSPLW